MFSIEPVLLLVFQHKGKFCDGLVCGYGKRRDPLTGEGKLVSES
jgi:hypothetical protein